ncbi:hypothetical protein F1880_009468 [Penicillium rolfsii]|nr:hypothetical protein F1880_009468 [Penicillium rolfsii]
MSIESPQTLPFSKATGRLELRPLTEDDLHGFHEILSDEFSTRWSPLGANKSIHDTERWMSQLLRNGVPDGLNMAILFRGHGVEQPHDARNSDRRPNIQPGKFIGWIGVWKLDPVPEVGMIFHRDSWGHGFATEALSAFLAIFWELRTHLSTLTAFCDTENAASIRVMQKCGFQQRCIEKGECTLPWMDPPLRDSIRFEKTRPINPRPL